MRLADKVGDEMNQFMFISFRDNTPWLTIILENNGRLSVELKTANAEIEKLLHEVKNKVFIPQTCTTEEVEELQHLLERTI